jgi:simple sugar transport system ATP-binding protein
MMTRRLTPFIPCGGCGIAVVVISSYLLEILSLSDRILVTRQGRVVEEFSAGHADEARIMYAAVH